MLLMLIMLIWEANKNFKNKMIKTYCDRCGKEIKISYLKGTYKEHLDEIKFNSEKYYRLCPECYNEFHKWRNKK